MDIFKVRPKVTIAMPVYNGGHYFRAALESALAQTYENVEIIVVNDGSTDAGETRAVAQDYASRIHYIEQPNKGVAGALNTAVAAMTGDFFAWLSHDDLHLPHKTERQIAYFEKIGKADAILFSDYDFIDPDGTVIVQGRLPHEAFCAKPMLPLLNGAINGCTLLIPAELMRRYGPFDESLRYTQDYDLWNVMLARHEFFHQPETLVRYRIHPGQDSHKPQAVTEGDVLWRRMLDARTPIEQAQLFGSSRRYFSSLGEFLEKTPYKEAAAYAQARASEGPEQTLVSVVVPVRNGIPVACDAVRSVLEQTHRNCEVVVVDDGSTDSTADLASLADEDNRVRLVRQESRGLAAARNLGMEMARGEYIAFLDPDSRFLPLKVQRQLELMQRSGSLFSHTSYYARSPELLPELGVSRSGAFGGGVYPAIIGECPVATGTVMIHRLIRAESFLFPETLAVDEDALLWIDIAARHDLLGIDEPLTIVEWLRDSTALDLDKNIARLSRLLGALAGHPVHSRHTSELAVLRSTLSELERNRHAEAGGSAGHRLCCPLSSTFESGIRIRSPETRSATSREVISA